ncbi:hypothetical protein BC938DRAFT_483255 [Jimgerdemannia flammicorona]|uniref:Uncharacterized protein n=1 Tax=Jimgerdemannia flammicorona TaxID=994334 RepID=A0A433QCC6_9FUNG|nr:hypothetical protein BC938DRAFT_483255 [Jimgerdemannia flammicorona]
MHRSLIDAIVIADGGRISRHVLAAVPGLLMPGFLTSRFSIRVILVMYVGAGFYLSTDLASFDIPLNFKGLNGVLKMARIMLQTIERAESERFSSEKVSFPARLEEFKSPKKLKKKRSIGGS